MQRLHKRTKARAAYEFDQVVKGKICAEDLKPGTYVRGFVHQCPECNAIFIGNKVSIVCSVSCQNLRHHRPRRKQLCAAEIRRQNEKKLLNWQGAHVAMVAKKPESSEA